MKRIKTDYTGWALCCIAREIDKAWVSKGYATDWIRRLYRHEDFTNPDKYFMRPDTVVRNLIHETRHAHWPGKASMIRELQRRLNEYNQSQSAGRLQ